MERTVFIIISLLTLSLASSDLLLALIDSSETWDIDIIDASEVPPKASLRSDENRECVRALN